MLLCVLIVYALHVLTESGVTMMVSYKGCMVNGTCNTNERLIKGIGEQRLWKVPEKGFKHACCQGRLPTDAFDVHSTFRILKSNIPYSIIVTTNHEL